MEIEILRVQKVKALDTRRLAAKPFRGETQLWGLLASSS